MRIIKRSTLQKFWGNPQHADSDGPLKAWYLETKNAEWRNPAEVKEKYPNASILKNGRVVFNIAGNNYRLVVKIHYNTGTVFIRFVGTHKDYDRIDADTV